MRTKAIIIDEMRHGETSKLIKAFTREYGVLSIMAKGALLPRSSIVSVSHLFALSTLELSPGANLYYIKKGSIINTHFELLNSYTKLLYGSFILELINKSLPPGDVNRSIFDLLEKTLSTLIHTDRTKLITLGFSLKCITLLGYRPSFPSEVGEDYYYSFERGEFIKGRSYLKSSFNLWGKDIEFLLKILYSTYEEIVEIDMDEEILERTFKFIVGYIKYLLELDDFYSLKLLEGEEN